jgi:hypothetical protein
MRSISSAQPGVGAAVPTREQMSNDQQALPRLRGPNRSRSLASFRRRLWRSLL